MRLYVPKSSEYHIEKHRYLELRFFCLQYPSWRQKAAECYDLKSHSSGGVRSSEPSNPTARAAEQAATYLAKMELVERCARDADSTLSSWILMNVTTGMGYEAMCRRGNAPPCGVNQFYRARQRFFFLLSMAKK